MDVTLNGSPVVIMIRGGFIELESPISKGDSLEISISVRLRAYSLKDNGSVLAFKYGHYLLAAELGDENLETYRSGVAVAFAKDSISDGVLKLGAAAEAVKKNPEKYLERTGDIVYEGGGLRFIPYYLIKNRYGIYWNIQ